MNSRFGLTFIIVRCIPPGVIDTYDGSSFAFSFWSNVRYITGSKLLNEDDSVPVSKSVVITSASKLRNFKYDSTFISSSVLSDTTPGLNDSYTSTKALFPANEITSV